jgi:dihydroorotate dehydrogenase electron transfer subunit
MQAKQQTNQQAIHQAIINANYALAPNLFVMVLQAPELAKKAKPGQFVMLLVTQDKERHDPLLRRPFGISGIDPVNGLVRLTYQLAGRGTLQMSRWQKGDTVNLIGALGNGFTWSPKTKHVYIAGGGMGIAPLLPLAQALCRQQIKVTAFLGARKAELLFGYQELDACGCQLYITTEDGSMGQKGFVTQALEQELNNSDCDLLFACGPTPFLKAVQALRKKFNVQTQLSLEERMACGVGACMGCVVPIKDAAGQLKNARICCDGPVFNAEEVIFNG